MQTKVSKIFNSIILFIFIYFGTFMWTYYIVKSLYKSLFLSILFSGIIFILLRLLTNKNNYNKNLNKEKQKIITYIKEQLLFGSNDQIQNFFYELLSKYKICKKNNNILEIEVNSKNFYIYLLFKDNYIDESKFIKFTKNNDMTKNNHIIFCIDYDSNINNLLINSNLNIKFLNIAEIYDTFLLPSNTTPDFNIKINKSTKINWKNFFKFAFNKNKAKSYFFSALFISFANFFVKFNIYYSIFSSILIVLSIICLLSKNPSNQQNNLNLTFE